MIRLPAGTPRYLLVHPSEVERNAERAKQGAPVAIVVELEPEGERGKVMRARLHRGYRVVVNGRVELEYSQRDPLFVIRMAPGEEDTKVHAAYGTTDEVLLAETPDESLEEEPQPTPQPEKKAKKQ